MTRPIFVASLLFALPCLCAPAWSQQAAMKEGDHPLSAVFNPESYPPSGRPPTNGSDRPLAAVFGPKEKLGAWWSPPLTKVEDRMQAVHIALLPNGRVLIVNGSSNRNRVEKGEVRDGISPLDYAAVNNTSLFDPEAAPTDSGMTRIPSPPSPIPNVTPVTYDDLFCSGHLQDTNGNVVFAGGTLTYYPGEKFLGSRNTNFFDWKAGTWRVGPEMTDGHWYPSLVPLADGRILVISGLSHDVFSNSSVIEIYDPAQPSGSQWSSVDVRRSPNGPFFTPVNVSNPLPMTGTHGSGMAHSSAGLDDMDHYPRIAPLPDGRLLITGDGSGGGNVDSSNTYIMTVGPRPTAGQPTQISFQRGPDRSGYRKTFGTAFMDPNAPGSYMLVAGLQGSGDINLGPGDPPPDPRINTVGSAERYTPPAAGTADVGTWTTFPAFLGSKPDDRREMLVGVLLPTKQVLLMGGGMYGTSAPTFSPFLLTPDKAESSGYKVEVMNPAQQPRLYHTSSLLLPDGRVFLGGGNASRATRTVETGEVRLDTIRTPNGTWTFAPKGSNFVSAEIYQPEIFYPPYLFINGPTPVIQAAPAVLHYGEAAALTVSDATSDASAVLIKLGSMTHAWDMGQRLADLQITSSEGASSNVRITAPTNRNLYPPGYYMLFYVNKKGKPSEAAILQLQ